MQVVISVCHDADNHSPFPAQEGEELLAWLNPDAQTLSEAPGQSYETPCTWVGTIPLLSPMCFDCLCPSLLFFFIFHAICHV